MTIHKMKLAASLHGIVGAAILVFIFFLPLHFHSPFTAQIAKECSCIHGTRTQPALPAGAITVAPALLVTILAAQYEFLWAGDWSTLQNVRGPPAIRSA